MGEPVKTSAPGGAVEASSQAAPAAAGLPIQAESLEAQAARLAESHAAVRRGVFLPPLTRDLKAYRDLMVQAIRRFRGAGEQELALSYAAEWVLDNDYIVQQALRQVAEDLPAKFYRQLPKLAAGPLAGQPRVYALARWLIETENARLDLGRVMEF
ncbi:MAG TPA: hypothetical protein VF823_06865, partial [Anaerolineales bacterium]